MLYFPQNESRFAVPTALGRTNPDLVSWEDGMGEDSLKVTVSSMRGLDQHPARCFDYEFEDALVESMGAEVTTLRGRSRPGGRLPRMMSRLLRKAGYDEHVHTQVHADSVAPDQDIFLFNCLTIHDVASVQKIPNWRENSRFTVCWIKEFFVGTQHDPAGLALLEQFDLVILSFEQSVEALSKLVRGPKIVYLPLGIDTIRFCPYPNPPEQKLDVFWLGRSEPELHSAIQRQANVDGLYYVFNTTFPAQVAHPAEHRAQRIREMQRSRLFVVMPAKFNEPEVTLGQEEAGFRYFEGAAAGAVLLGRAPDVKSFSELFPWRDSVIPLPDNASSVGPFVADLLTQHDRLDRIRRESVRHCLLHHDWAYRMLSMCELLGFSPARAHKMLAPRLRTLQDLAELAVPSRPRALGTRRKVGAER